MEKIIGFDVRESISKTFDWSPERRRKYLIKQNILKPLSIDPNVWHYHSVKKTIFDDDLLRSDYQMWNSLDVLWNKLLSNPLRFYSVIAVTIVLTPEDEDLYANYFMPTVTLPFELKKEWQFLGYDIADTGLLSGISNCGDSFDSINHLKEIWESSINDYHLLKSIDDAYRFKEKMENRIPEHKPFFIYGLYLVYNNGDKSE